MSTLVNGPLCFWQAGGPENLHFGHLHGTHIDFNLIARTPQLRRALMIKSPELRIAVVKRGKVESLLDRDQVADLIRKLRPPDDGE